MTYKHQDGEFEQHEYHNKLLADDFSGMSFEEMEEEREHFERAREKRVRHHARIERGRRE